MSRTFASFDRNGNPIRVTVPADASDVAAPHPRTYVTTNKARASACGEVGAIDLTYRETVHANGLVDFHVTGTADGESVNHRGTRNVGRALDLDVVHAARIAQGWREVSS